MHARDNQRGMTFMGMVIVLAIAGFFVLVGLKLFPVYVEMFKVTGAMESLIEQSEIEKKSTADIRTYFMRYMAVEDVARFDDQQLIKKVMKVQKKKGGITISLAYEIRAPLFGNLSILADYSKTVSK